MDGEGTRLISSKCSNDIGTLVPQLLSHIFNHNIIYSYIIKQFNLRGSLHGGHDYINKVAMLIKMLQMMMDFTCFSFSHGCRKT